MSNNKFLMKESKAPNFKTLKKENKFADFFVGNWKLPARLNGVSRSGGEIGNFNKGFTIVELLVAIGLFGAIVSIAMGGFVRALQTQKQIVALITANSNVSLVIEQMSREIRTGFNFCNLNCPSDSLTFTNSRGEQVTYAYGVAVGYGTITRQVGSGNINPITADNVNIRYLNFKVSENPSYPPRVTILVGLSPKIGQAINVSENITNIQTTVSVRSFTP